MRVLIIMWLCLSVMTGCKNHQENHETSEPPVTLTKAPNGEFNFVTLSEIAAKRVGIELTPVKQYVAAQGVQTAAKQVPYSAIIYGIHGEAWVYVLIKPPLTFIRSPVIIDQIINDLAVITSGPAINTPVVSVGASELYGSEYMGNIEA